MVWWQDLLLKYSGNGTSNYATYTGSSLGGFSGSNKINSANGTTINFSPGSTLWVIFYNNGTIGSTTENILSSCTTTGSKGWRFVRAGTASGATQGKFYLQTSAAAQQIVTAPIGVSTLCLRWRASDNDLSYSAGGNSFISWGAIAASAAQDGTCAVRVGTANGGDGGIPLGSGGVIAFAVWSREATATEAFTNTYTSGNRLILPAAITGDANCIVDCNLKRDYSASGFSTLGSSPVSLTVTGTPLFTVLDEQRISTYDAMYWDGKVSQAGALSGYKIRNGFSKIKTLTDSTRLGYEWYNTETLLQTAVYAGVGIYSNGSYQTTPLDAHLDVIAQRNYIQDISLPAGSAKMAEFWEGAQILGTVNSQSEVLGTFVNAIRLPLNTNSSVITPTPPQKRLVLLGDSIMAGFFPSVPQQTSITAKLRADFPTSGTGGVTCHAWGNNTLANLTCTSSAVDMNKVNATAALLASELDGTSSNTLWIQLGTNDYGLVAINTTVFLAAYNALLSAVIALVPSVVIYCQSPVQRIAPASEAANGFGFTLGNYRTQVSSAASSHPGNCTFVDGTTVYPNPTIYNAGTNATGDYFTDGLHNVDVGCADYKAFIKTTIGY